MMIALEKQIISFGHIFFQVVDVYGHEKDQYDIHKLEITNVPIENN